MPAKGVLDTVNGDSSMATFITAIKFTEQGIKGIGDTTKRAVALKTAAKKMGFKVTDRREGYV